VDAVRAERLDGVARDLVGLDAADDLLDVVVEILHPDGGAVHAQPGQRGQPGFVDLVGVDLDGELGPVGQWHGVGDGMSQIAHLVGSKQRRRTAAPVQPCDADTFGAGSP
jgi:hypothetical protein